MGNFWDFVKISKEDMERLKALGESKVEVKSRKPGLKKKKKNGI